MKGLLRKTNMFFEYVSGAGVLMGAVIVIVMVVMITVNVFVRKAMNWAFLFVEEYSGYGLVFIVYLGLAYALRTNKHIQMELVVRNLPQRIANLIELFTSLVCLALLVYLIIKGIQFVAFSFHFRVKSEWYSESILWPFHLFIPIGLSIFILEMIRHIIKVLTKITTKEDLTEAKEH